MFLVFLIERDQESSTISRSSVSSLKTGITGTPIGGGMDLLISSYKEVPWNPHVVESLKP